MATKSANQKKNGPELLEHWYTLVPGHQFSPKEFYDSVETELNAQGIPALKTERVEIFEGGILSDKRIYLRMKRERLNFDICAAPVGVNFFFSYRFYLDPALLKFRDIVVACTVVALLVWALSSWLGFVTGSLLSVALCTLCWTALRNAASKGLKDLDVALSDAIVFGPIYERFFRRDTYFRQDVRIAFCSIASSIVKNRVEKLTAEKGVELSREFTNSPAFGDLYEMKETARPPKTVVA